MGAIAREYLASYVSVDFDCTGSAVFICAGEDGRAAPVPDLAAVDAAYDYCSSSSDDKLVYSGDESSWAASEYVESTWLDISENFCGVVLGDGCGSGHSVE